MLADGFGMDHLIQMHSKEIMNIQPEDEVILVGYSFGGNVAFGVAHCLREQSHKVKKLILIDSAADKSGYAPASRRRNRSFRVVKFVRSLLGEDGRGYAGRVLGERLVLPRATSVLRRFLWVGRVCASGARGFWLMVAHHARLSWRQRELQSWLATSPSCRKVLDTPTLLVCSNKQLDQVNQELGWKQICRKLSLVRVPGDHHSIFEDENVELMSEAIIEFLKMDIA
jgi:thioesterase domain-containing protein